MGTHRKKWVECRFGKDFDQGIFNAVFCTLDYVENEGSDGYHIALGFINDIPCRLSYTDGCKELEIRMIDGDSGYETVIGRLNEIKEYWKELEAEVTLTFSHKEDGVVTVIFYERE